MSDSNTINGAQRRGPRPASCATCRNPERGRAELLLAGGASLKSVAAKLSLSYHSLRRHWLRHVSEETKRMLTIGPCHATELAAKLADENVSVLDHLRICRAALYNALDAATTAGDRNGTALLIGRLHENLGLASKLTGELAQSPLVVNQSNVLVTGQFKSLQADLLHVLARFPDACAVVAHELKRLEQATLMPFPEDQQL